MNFRHATSDKNVLCYHIKVKDYTELTNFYFMNFKIRYSYYSAIKCNKLPIQATTWINLKNKIIVSEGSQT